MKCDRKVNEVQSTTPQVSQFYEMQCKMRQIDKSIILKLKALLPDLYIVTPDSADYEKAIERYRNNGITKAVSTGLGDWATWTTDVKTGT